MEAKMVLTKSFRELCAAARSGRSGIRRRDAPRGGGTLLAGDADTGKAIPRNYIKATVGFEQLSEAIGTQFKSLIRMLGPRGNPQARNLFGIIAYCRSRPVWRCM
jgi:hypothetical protein